MAKSSVTERDGGMKAFKERLAELKASRVSVRVGVVGANAAKEHDGSNGATISEIGEAHEFGLGTLAGRGRSWLRGYVDENRDQIREKIRRLSRQVLDLRRTKSGLSPFQAMNLLGLDAVGGIVQRIQSGIAPPVTGRTQKRKGPDKTTALINTAQFIGSITHEVVEGGEEGEREV